MKSDGTNHTIHDLFYSLDEIISKMMVIYELTHDERQQLHQMISEHHDDMSIQVRVSPCVSVHVCDAPANCEAHQ